MSVAVIFYKRGEHGGSSDAQNLFIGPKNKFYFCGNSNVFNCVKAACAAVVKIGCNVMIKSLLLLILLIMILCFDLNRRSKSDPKQLWCIHDNAAFEKQ